MRIHILYKRRDEEKIYYKYIVDSCSAILHMISYIYIKCARRAYIIIIGEERERERERERRREGEKERNKKFEIRIYIIIY